MKEENKQGKKMKEVCENCKHYSEEILNETCTLQKCYTDRHMKCKEFELDCDEDEHEEESYRLDNQNTWWS